MSTLERYLIGTVSTSSGIISTSTSPIRSGRGLTWTTGWNVVTFSEPYPGGVTNYKVEAEGWDSSDETTERNPVVLRFAIRNKADTGFEIYVEESCYGDYTTTIDS